MPYFPFDKKRRQLIALAVNLISGDRRLLGRGLARWSSRALRASLAANVALP
jgi:hypothetical protein